MQVRSIALLPNEMLLYHGAMVIELVLGGQLSCDILGLVKLFDQTIAEQRIKSPAVIIDGRVPCERDPDEVLELIQVLKRKHYGVLGKCYGGEFPRWLPECDKSMVMITNDPWLEYQCDEVQYIPPLEGPLIEPQLGAASSALKNLFLSVRYSPIKVFEFLTQAVFPWQITTQPKLQYALMLLKEKT